MLLGGKACITGLVLIVFFFPLSQLLFKCPSSLQVLLLFLFKVSHLPLGFIICSLHPGKLIFKFDLIK
ncbi:hypothetical protein NC651_025659 [Populus alba x Populus x berolinensis]|nr:hypothetical protein NC651_025659 [Populus alba x Populus x berolinensis]